MAEVILILGSNLGDKKQFIADAQKMISVELGQIINESMLYKSMAWGMEVKSDEEAIFFNKVVKVESILKPLEVLDKVQQIERSLGRTRVNSDYYESRTIDIDILFYDDLIFNNVRLQIPHNQIPFRRFVLIPLAEIVPYKVHPVLKKNILTLLEECEDRLEVDALIW